MATNDNAQFDAINAPPVAVVPGGLLKPASFDNVGVNPVPGGVVGLVVASVTMNSVTLRWSPPVGVAVTGYRAVNTTGASSLVPITTTATTVTFTGLNASTVYVFDVTTFNSVGDGPTVVVSGTTSADPTQGGTIPPPVVVPPPATIPFLQPMGDAFPAGFPFHPANQGLTPATAVVR